MNIVVLNCGTHSTFVIPPLLANKIADLYASGRRVTAIYLVRVHRDLPALGLMEAKDLCDNISKIVQNYGGDGIP